MTYQYQKKCTHCKKYFLVKHDGRILCPICRKINKSYVNGEINESTECEN